MVTVNSLIKKIKNAFSFLSFVNTIETPEIPEVGSTKLYIKPDNRLYSLDSFGNEVEYLTDNIELQGDITGTIYNTIIPPNSLSFDSLQNIPSNTFLGRISEGEGSVEVLTVEQLLTLLGLDNSETELGLQYFTESQYSIYPTVSSQFAVKTTAAKGALVLKPKGDGFISIQSPDGTVDNGIVRGDASIDFQRYRVNSTQVASGLRSFIGNGLGNLSGGVNSFIGNGENNYSLGLNSSVLNGTFNINTGNNSSILNGVENIISSNRSIAIGAGCNTFTRENIKVFSAGSEEIGGDAQFVRAIYRNVTTNNIPTLLTSDSELISSYSNIYALQNFQTANVTFTVVCNSRSSIQKAGFKIEAVVSRNYGGVVNIDWVYKTVQYKSVGLNTADANLVIIPDIGVAIQVMGTENIDLIWVASLESVEVIRYILNDPEDNYPAPNTDFGDNFSPWELIGTGNTSFDGNPNTDDFSLGIPSTIYPGDELVGVAGEIVPGTSRYVGLALVYDAYTGEKDIYGNFLFSKVVIYNGALTAEDPASEEARQEATTLPDTGCIEEVVNEPTYVKRCAWYPVNEQPHDPFSGSQLTDPCPAGTYYTGYVEFPEGEYKVMCCVDDEVSPIPPEIDSPNICAELNTSSGFRITLTGSGPTITQGQIITVPISICGVMVGKTNIVYIGPYLYTDSNDIPSTIFSGNYSQSSTPAECTTSFSSGSIYNGAGNLVGHFSSDQGDFYVYFAQSFGAQPAVINNVVITAI